MKYDEVEMEMKKYKHALRASDLERSNLQAENKAFLYNSE